MGQQIIGDDRRKALVFELPNQGGTLEFVWVPGGKFTLEGGHKITLPEFRLSKYPITQRQYQAIVGKNPSHFTEALITSEERKKNLDQRDRPVDSVSWHNAVAFCTKLSAVLKQTARLPSETEWEYAARGADQSKNYTYAGSNDLNTVGWYDGNSYSKTHPVGQLDPNEIDLYDMSGNVWEWCGDICTSEPSHLPSDGKALLSGENSSLKAGRGGSWYSYPEYCRISYRDWDLADLDVHLLGFRVVLAFPS